MLLVSNEFSDETVTIEDSSHESTARIRLVIDHGKVVSAEPESTVVFLGGG